MVDSCSRIVVCFIITDTLAASSVSVVLGKDIIIYTDTYLQHVQVQPILLEQLSIFHPALCQSF